MRRGRAGRRVASKLNASARRHGDGGCLAHESRPAVGIAGRPTRPRRAVDLRLSRMAVHDAGAERHGPLDGRRLCRPRAASRAGPVLRVVGLPAVAPLVRRRPRRAPTPERRALRALARGPHPARLLRRARRLDPPAVGPAGNPWPAAAAGRRVAAVRGVRPEPLGRQRHEAQPADVVARRRGQLLRRCCRRSAGWPCGCRGDGARWRSFRSRSWPSASSTTGRSPGRA